MVMTLCTYGYLFFALHFEYDTMEELAELVENREKWNLEVNTIKLL